MPSMTGLRITHGPESIHITGTVEQIERLFTLAIEGVRANLNCQGPFNREANQQELDDLRSIHKEWFTP